MSWYTSGQNNQNIRYWLLNSAHADYETRRAAIESLSSNYAIANGSVANTKVVTGTATDAQIASNSLDIGGAVLDRVHNYVNANASAATIRTNAWGDKYPVWGQFLEQPEAIPTTGIDRLVQHWKDGLGNAVYIGQDNAGTGNGSSYANRRRVKDFLDLDGGAAATVDPTTYDIVVLCGRLSRFVNEGVQTNLFTGSGLCIKTGTSGSRTQLIAHPVAGGSLMGSPKLASGAHGEPADFTNEGGGVWSLIITANSGPGGGDLNLAGEQHVMSDAGGTLRAITKKSSLAACQAATDSYFVETNYSGSNDRIYIHLADGSNPKATTYVGACNAGGISFIMGDTQFFDVYGVDFYQQAFLGSYHSGNSDFTFYACGFHYVHHLPMFRHVGGSVIEATGGYDATVGGPDPVPHNRKWVGCEASHGYVFIYDAYANYLAPVDTTFQDCYFHHWNLLDDYGLTQNFSSSDAHTLTNQGCDGWYILNCRFDTIAAQPIVVYIGGNNFNTPSAALALTDGYVNSWHYPSGCLDNGDGTWYSPGICKDVLCSANLITNVLTAADDAGYDTNGQGIAFQGGQGLIGILDQYSNIIVEYNRLEGNFTEAALRTKLTYYTGQTSYPIFRYNTVRGSDCGFMQIQTLTVDGINYDPSFRFEYNDVYALTYFVRNTNQLYTDNHSQYFDNNTYRNDDGAFWQDGAASNYTTIALWRAAQPTGDVYDPNSTHTALTTDTGSSAITASGGPSLGSTLTATIGADPDGATSSPFYQWFRNDVLIASATGATYAATVGNGNAVNDVLKCVVLAKDAKDKWFLVTSNSITLTAAGGAVVDDGDATVSITGTAQEDSVLTANFADNDPDGVATGITYQWQRSGVDISGQTGVTYTLAPADVGATVRVKVNYTDAEGFAETIYSAATATVTAFDDGESTVTITGTAMQGNTLTANFADNDPDGSATEITYQWQMGDAVDIGGATASALALTVAHVGSRVRVKITYTDAQGFSETIFSAYTAAVSPPIGSGGIPISEGEYYRRKKKAFLTRMWDWIKRQFQ
jgi:hypothetical protein